MDSKETETTHFDAKVGMSADLKCGVAVSESLATFLGILEKETFETELVANKFGAISVRKDNPFLSEDQKAKLSANGLAREGAQLLENDPLVSALAPTGKQTSSGAELFEDYSIYLPRPFVGCVVTESSVVSHADPDTKSSVTHVKVSVEITRRLIEGSSIELGGSTCLVTRIVPDEELRDQREQVVEIALSKSAAKLAGISNASNVQVSVVEPYYHSRFCQSFGPRSLITSQPLMRIRPAITIDTRQIKWLSEHGCHRLIDEFVTLRSDVSKPQRDQCQESCQQAGFTTFSWQNEIANETLVGIALHLQAIGLGANVNRDPERDCIELNIAPLSEEEILEASFGEVKKPETIHYKTYENCEDGLFCDKIFGEDISRRRRSAHIDLVVPVVPWLYRQGSPSIAELMTGLPAKDIEEIVHCELDVAIVDGQFELVPTEESEPDKGEVFRGAQGLLEIAKLNGDANRDSIPPAFQQNPSLLAMSRLPVLPPDWRPLVLLDSGNFATSDLNDLYRRAINRNNRLKKLIELKAPEVILNNETRMLQMCLDALFANGQLARPVLGEENMPLKAVFDMLGFASDRKRICWVARDIAVPDISLDAAQVAVPSDFFKELKLSEEVPVLVEFPESHLTGYVALRPISGAEAIRLHPTVFQSFSLSPEDRHSCIIHRVLSDAGKEEAAAMLRSKPQPKVAEANSHFLFGDCDIPNCVSILVDCLKQPEVIRLDSPAGLLAGRGTEFTMEGASEWSRPRTLLPLANDA